MSLEEASVPGGRRPSHLLSGKRWNYHSSCQIGMHPKGSGSNSNISLADLVSLDRKIRSRAGSSEFIHNNSEMSSSRNISCRSSINKSEQNFVQFTRDDLLRAFDCSEGTKSSCSSPSNRLLSGKGLLPAFFSRDSVRVACIKTASCSQRDGDGDGDRDGRDLEAGLTSIIVGPHLRPRESPEQIRAIRVLVVDDSLPTRKLMQRVLSKKGYDVQCAEDGLVCLAIMSSTSLSSPGEGEEKTAGTEPFDVIIMDDIMPNMGGRDAARILREKGFTGLICGVTGNTSDEDELLFMAYGADLVLPKPLNLGLFEERMEDHVKFRALGERSLNRRRELE